jgi:hypothetical protein
MMRGKAKETAAAPTLPPGFVIRSMAWKNGYSRSKNGVASLAYAPVVHAGVTSVWIAGSSPAMTQCLFAQPRRPQTFVV